MGWRAFAAILVLGATPAAGSAHSPGTGTLALPTSGIVADWTLKVGTDTDHYVIADGGANLVVGTEIIVDAGMKHLNVFTVPFVGLSCISAGPGSYGTIWMTLGSRDHAIRFDGATVYVLNGEETQYDRGTRPEQSFGFYLDAAHKSVVDTFADLLDRRGWKGQFVEKGDCP